MPCILHGVRRISAYFITNPQIIIHMELYSWEYCFFRFPFRLCSLPFLLAAHKDQTSPACKVKRAGARSLANKRTYWTKAKSDSEKRTRKKRTTETACNLFSCAFIIKFMPCLRTNYTFRIRAHRHSFSLLLSCTHTLWFGCANCVIKSWLSNYAYVFRMLTLATLTSA